VETEQRIERLERQNWLLTIGIVGVLLVAMATGPLRQILSPKPAIAQGANIPRIVEAQGFRLVDQSGKARALLGFKERAAGLYIYPQKPRKDNSPLLSLEVYPLKAPPGTEIEIENASGSFQSGITQSCGTISGNNIGLYGGDDSIELSYLQYPSLEFVDCSGLPFIELSHNKKDGVDFTIRTPLGIKGALKEGHEALADHKEPDPRIGEAYSRSVRFEFRAKPFADPFMRLSKDGRVIWTALPE
jgi:hypothetical protein